MPNDAKLGLLAGVIGVIVVAVMSANRPQPATDPGVNTPDSPSTTAAKPAEDAKPAAPVARSPEPSSTPVVRTKKEPEGTPTSRTPMDDIDP